MTRVEEQPKSTTTKRFKEFIPQPMGEIAPLRNGSDGITVVFDGSPSAAVNNRNVLAGLPKEEINARFQEIVTGLQSPITSEKPPGPPTPPEPPKPPDPEPEPGYKVAIGGDWIRSSRA